MVISIQRRGDTDSDAADVDGAGVGYAADVDGAGVADIPDCDAGSGDAVQSGAFRLDAPANNIAYGATFLQQPVDVMMMKMRMRMMVEVIEMI